MPATTLQPFYSALMQFLALSKQHMFKIAGEYGLSPTQAFILALIDDHEPRTMNSFCGLLGCDASNITGIVDGLERKQLLKRGEHPTDRRIKTLHLKPQGREIREAIFRQLSDRDQSYILSKLTKEEVAQFTQLIQKITSSSHPLDQAVIRP